MFVDYIMNGQGFGQVGEALAGCHFDPGLLRPYLDSKGRYCVTVNTGRKETRKDQNGNIICNAYGEPIYFPVKEKYLVSEMMMKGIPIPVTNATALRKDEWAQLDTVVITAARERLRAWADLAAASTFGGFNGMGKLMLEHESMSDPGEAFIDFDGMTEGRNDAPLFKLEGLPLPIVHSDFWFSSRKLAVSRNSGTPIDTTMGEAAGRRVAEKIEQMVIGRISNISLGVDNRYSRTPQVYGYTNYPDRITKSNVTAPTAQGWTPKKTVDDVLSMIELAADANFFGPFMLYHSTDWDAYMDNDYSTAYATGSLRQRLRQIDQIRDVRRLDWLKTDLNPFTLLLVQMTPSVARAVDGMGITTVQWQSMGGMRLNFKVMAIQVPQLRSNFAGDTGIVHGTTS